jgi:uncharacterized protein (DUF4415 family)
MDISFDPAKNTSNLVKHGVNMSLAAEFEWDTAVTGWMCAAIMASPAWSALATLATACLPWPSLTEAKSDASSVCEKRTNERRESMPALKKTHVFVTDEEDAAITAAAMLDPDAKPFTDAELDAARSAMRRGGRPLKAVHKVPTTIRFDADVLAALKASGKGWQTRVNAAMREWLKTHSQV